MRSSTTGSACTRPWATAPRPRRGPAWKGSPCARPRDVLISSLHSSGGAPVCRSSRPWSGDAPPDGDARGPARPPVAARPPHRPGGPAAGGRGALPLAGDPPPAALRDAGGADDLVEVALRGDGHPAFLRRFPPCEPGVPSRDTLGGAVAALGPALLEGCFAGWVGGLREAGPDLVAVDGKTSRRTRDRGKGREPPHLVSARAARQRLVLGREAVGGKSNETAAIPLVLGRLALDSALVTIDAAGTRSTVAATVLARGGDHLLALEANRPATLEEVEAFGARPPA